MHPARVSLPGNDARELLCTYQRFDFRFLHLDAIYACGDPEEMVRIWYAIAAVWNAPSTQRDTA